MICGTICGIACPSGKGKWLIIVYAGSEDGWVPNGSIVHNDNVTIINHTILRNGLLIIINNALYQLV